MINEFAQQLIQDLSRLAEGGRASAEAAFSPDKIKAVVESAVARAGLVSREEFDAQRAVLAKTRAKLDELETKVRALEQPSVK